MPAAAATAQDRSRPIGVFDSGVGGLSVLREIRRALPAEALCYVADSAHAPYGERSVAYIEARSRHIIGFLQAQGAKAVVVACNTVTGLVIGHLRAAFPGLPLIAIEPAVKPAAQSTRSGVIGLLATRQTVASPGLQRLLQLHASDRQVLLQACPGWVERVERGELDGSETEAAVAQYLRPLLAQGADTLVLGCTHYPLLLGRLERLAPWPVDWIDSALTTAELAAERLQQAGLARSGGGVADYRFVVSDVPLRFQTIGERFLGRSLGTVGKVDW